MTETEKRELQFLKTKIAMLEQRLLRLEDCCQQNQNERQLYYIKRILAETSPDPIHNPGDLPRPFTIVY
jgi:cell shape-determining protein MreC